jgi:site-specific recombinase XerD
VRYGILSRQRKNDRLHDPHGKSVMLLAATKRYALDTSEDRPIFQLTRQQVYNIVHRYGRTISKKIHPHTLSHSFAINCAAEQDLRRLQLLLGHSSLAVTQQYLLFSDAAIIAAYNSVDFGRM